MPLRKKLQCKKECCRQKCRQLFCFWDIFLIFRKHFPNNAKKKRCYSKTIKLRRITNMTIPQNQCEEFHNLIQDIITTEEFCKMKGYKHHLHGSTYDHSIRVAYLCYQHYKKAKSNVNIKELIRGALHIRSVHWKMPGIIIRI